VIPKTADLIHAEADEELAFENWSAALLARDQVCVSDSAACQRVCLAFQLADKRWRSAVDALWAARHASLRAGALVWSVRPIPAGPDGGAR